MFLFKLLLAAILLAPVLLLVWCAYFFGLLLYGRWRYRHLPTPKFDNFIFGHSAEIIECINEGGHFSMLVSKWAKQLGPVFVIHFIHRSSVTCLEPSIVRELLINNISESPKPYEQYGTFQFLFGKRLAGYGLFSELDHESWEKKRKMFNPAFKRKYLIDLMYQYNNSIQELISHLSPKADGNTKILMAEEFNKVAMDIIAKVAFGLNDLNVIADDDSPFCKAAAQTFTGVLAWLKNPFHRLDFRAEARRVRAKTCDAIDLIRGTGKKCILGRIQDIKEGKDYPKDILTHILEASHNLQDSMNFGLENMIDEFTTFFVAGQETTAQLMSFAFEMIGRYPEIYKKVQEEIDSVIGDKESISYDDTCKLEYLNLVLKEVLRYAPPAPGVERVTLKDLVVNGYKIPSGSRISLNHYAMGRDERFFEDPEKFDPERFRDEDNNRLYAYFPFSLGPRICIGQHFAMIEAKVIIAKLLQTFDFTLVPGVKLEYLAEVTLKSKNRTPIYLTPRKGQLAM